MRVKTTEHEQGSAYAVALILAFTLAGSVGVLVVAGNNQSRSSLANEWHQRSALVADNGLAKAKVILLSNPALHQGNTNPDPTDASNLIFTEDDAQVYAQNMTGAVSSPWTYLVTSVGTHNDSVRELQMVLRLEQTPSTPLRGPALGAIVAAGDVNLTGSIVVNGNDHDREGNPTSGFDAPGVVTTTGVNLSGSSTVGGNGTAPAKSKSAADGTHFDSSTTIWGPAEANTSDGIDDDGDGIIDEDGNFPANPGKVFGLSDESDLRASAQATNTYFTSKAAYDAWLAGASASDRSGKVIYVEIPAADSGTLGQFDLPNNPAPAHDPSLVIVSREPVSGTIAHDLVLGPLHVEGGNGTFQGMLVTDSIDKVNGNVDIIGSIFAFSAANASTFGNGNADILFSSEVVNNLPGVNPSGGTTTAEIVAWREDR